MNVFVWVVVCFLIVATWVACVFQSELWTTVFGVSLVLYCVWAFVPDYRWDDEE